MNKNKLITDSVKNKPKEKIAGLKIYAVSRLQEVIELVLNEFARG